MAITTLNPKCVTVTELYGEFNPTTVEWTDGLLSSVCRRYAKESRMLMQRSLSRKKTLPFLNLDRTRTLSARSTATTTFSATSIDDGMEGNVSASYFWRVWRCSNVESILYCLFFMYMTHSLYGLLRAGSILFKWLIGSLTKIELMTLWLPVRGSTYEAITTNMEGGSLNLVLVNSITHDPQITGLMLYPLTYNNSRGEAII